MNINKFFESLASNNSRNFKIEQLTKYSDNELLRKVIRLALDPFTQFYIRKIPDYTPNKSEGISLNFALDSIGDLTKRLVTGNAGIEHLRSNLEALNYEDAKVLERVIQKDLKCGVDVSTANKVWDNLILEYPVMLCSQFDQKLVDKIKFPAYVQLKMDGMRFNAIVKDGKCDFRSRNGKEIQLLGNLESEFITLAGGKNVVFDGELLVNDKGVILDRQTGNGILNKANKGTIHELDARKVHATIWDVIPYDDFVVGKSTHTYKTRFSVLESLTLPKKISLVQTWVVDDYETAKALFEEFLQRGEEGIILKDMNGIWEDKRAKHQIKFKGELECDLKIVGIEEGTGKYAGMLGAILCESADGVVKTSVGSGFNDSQRLSLWAEHIEMDSLIGKIAAIKYNMRIKNKQGEESLFLPIVLEVRDDKEVADSSNAIK